MEFIQLKYYCCRHRHPGIKAAPRTATSAWLYIDNKPRHVNIAPYVLNPWSTASVVIDTTVRNGSTYFALHRSPPHASRRQVNRRRTDPCGILRTVPTGNRTRSAEDRPASRARGGANILYLRSLTRIEIHAAHLSLDRAASAANRTDTRRPRDRFDIWRR